MRFAGPGTGFRKHDFMDFFSPRIGRTCPGPAPEVEGIMTTEKRIDSSIERLL